MECVRKYIHIKNFKEEETDFAAIGKHDGPWRINKRKANKCKMQFAADMSFDVDCCKTKSYGRASGGIECRETFAGVNYTDFQAD